MSIAWVAAGTGAVFAVTLAGALELDKRLRWAWQRRKTQ